MDRPGTPGLYERHETHLLNPILIQARGILLKTGCPDLHSQGKNYPLRICRNVLSLAGSRYLAWRFYRKKFALSNFRDELFNSAFKGAYVLHISIVWFIIE